MPFVALVVVLGVEEQKQVGKVGNRLRRLASKVEIGEQREQKGQKEQERRLQPVAGLVVALLVAVVQLALWPAKSHACHVHLCDHQSLDHHDDRDHVQSPDDHVQSNDDHNHQKDRAQKRRPRVS